MMKKVIGLLVLLMALQSSVVEYNSTFTTTTGGCSSKAYAAPNVMTTYTSTFTIIADTAKPYIANFIPANNATGVAVNTPISFDILDDGAGVKESTIVVKVNGNIVPYTATAITKGYHVVINDLVFAYGMIVTVTVQGSDLVP